MYLRMTITKTAAEHLKEILADEGKSGLRVFVQGGGCSGFQYGLMVDDPQSGDSVFDGEGVSLYVDPISIRYLQGATVDYSDNLMGGGFTIKNPSATSTCGCGSSFTA